MSGQTLEERDALITQIELMMLGICLSPLILILLFFAIRFLYDILRDPANSIYRFRTGPLKLLTRPYARLYFRRRFGKSFFQIPTICVTCQIEPEMQVCPGCGWHITNSSWGYYVNSDMGMLEFAHTESQNIAKGKQVLEKRKNSKNPSLSKNTVSESSTNYTSSLLDDNNP